MNVLPRDKQIEAISAFTEGCSIRAIERLTGIHRDTIMLLGARVGNGCTTLHDAMMRGLHVSRIELDEAWSVVSKKQARVRPGDPSDTVTTMSFWHWPMPRRQSSAIGSASGPLRILVPSSPTSAPACWAHPRSRQTPSNRTRQQSNWHSVSTCITGPSTKNTPRRKR
jgi:hypothetical protein